MSLSLRWWTLWVAILVSPLLILGLLLLDPTADALFYDLDFHFYIVSGTALAAVVACLIVIGLTQTLKETRLVLLGLAFLSIASIFAVHGLATPGHIYDADEIYAELGISAWLSVFVGAGFIGLSALRMPASFEDWLKSNGAFIFGFVALALGLYIGLSVAWPDWLSWAPQGRSVQIALTAASTAMLALGAWRYFQAFLFARLFSQWAMVVALVLLIEVQIAMVSGRAWHYSWWLYHAMYVAAFVVLFVGWFIEARRAGSISVLAEALSMRDAIAQLNRGYSRPIADLIDEIEWKDRYTLGHVRRVAVFALMIGKELGLSTLDLRVLALGAQMHDVGKIAVPDRILKKPERLTAEEFAIIKEHSLRGYEIATKTAALRSVADTIRYHHERVDGTGYPSGLQGQEIPLHARIVSVADAYDAITSGRSYQPAVEEDLALAELCRVSGSQFDTNCVDAFVRAMTRIRKTPTGFERVTSDQKGNAA